MGSTPPVDATPDDLPKNPSWSLDACKTAVEQRLAELAPADMKPPQALIQAIRYTLLAPGKRVRPLLVLAAAAHCGADWRNAMDAACAVEMVHTASLILDDLPSMDNADLRRGQPTVHRLHGEDTAILAAIALMNQAFATLSSTTSVDIQCRLRMISRLARVIGPEGLVAGQSRDLRERTGNRSLEVLEEINRQKTGVLFQLSAEMGGMVAGAAEDRLASLRAFAEALGQAFQARDDLLDQIGNPAQLGKNTDKDNDKANLVKLMGEQGVREAVHRHTERALAALNGCGASHTHLQEFVRACMDPVQTR